MRQSVANYNNNPWTKMVLLRKSRNSGHAEGRVLGGLYGGHSRGGTKTDGSVMPATTSK